MRASRTHFFDHISRLVKIENNISLCVSKIILRDDQKSLSWVPSLHTTVDYFEE